LNLRHAGGQQNHCWKKNIVYRKQNAQTCEVRAYVKS
jgi:hypothetical protein